MIPTIKRGTEKIMDAIVDAIVLFTDYFILKKHITLSETVIFLFQVTWGLWFLFVGVYVAEMALSRAMWTTLFLMCGLAHFISFFFKDILGRALVVGFFAVLCCFLTLLSYYTGSVAPAVPTLFVIMFASVFISVRLLRERQNSKSL